MLDVDAMDGVLERKSGAGRPGGKRPLAWERIEAMSARFIVRSCQTNTV
jgi:hypothetical protein